MFSLFPKHKYVNYFFEHVHIYLKYLITKDDKDCILVGAEISVTELRIRFRSRKDAKTQRNYGVTKESDIELSSSLSSNK